jgi:hypothetical protein
MRAALLIVSLLFTPLTCPAEGGVALTAQDVIAVAQKQLTVPSEFAGGEMKVYRGEGFSRLYSFVMGKLWEEGTQTESVRLDFRTAVESALYPDYRYLLKRTPQTPPTQWLYLRALRRVRTAIFRAEEPLLQSDYLFYDLTMIQNFGDYRYRFVDPNEHAPVIEGEPQSPVVPYQKTIFALERRGETYLVTEMKYLFREKEKQVRFAAFTEIAPGRYRPQHMTVVGDGGRTEFVFHQWVLSPPEPQLFTPTYLETQTLTLPKPQGGNENVGR